MTKNPFSGEQNGVSRGGKGQNHNWLSAKIVEKIQARFEKEKKKVPIILSIFTTVLADNQLWFWSQKVSQILTPSPPTSWAFVETLGSKWNLIIGQKSR